MRRMPGPFVTSARCPLALVNQVNVVYGYLMLMEGKGHRILAEGNLLA